MSMNFRPGKVLLFHPALRILQSCLNCKNSQKNLVFCLSTYIFSDTKLQFSLLHSLVLHLFAINIIQVFNLNQLPKQSVRTIELPVERKPCKWTKDRFSTFTSDRLCSQLIPVSVA